MAHEIGHIVLHSGILNDGGAFDINRCEPDLGSEDEADCFAEKIIELRKAHNEELYKKI